MRASFLVVALVLLALALPAPVHAEHSASGCGSDVIAIGSGSTMLYLVEDHADGDIWLFEETNGHPSLQRQGHPWYNQSGFTYDMECWDVNLATGEEIPDPDTIIL